MWTHNNPENCRIIFMRWDENVSKKWVSKCCIWFFLIFLVKIPDHFCGSVKSTKNWRHTCQMASQFVYFCLRWKKALLSWNNKKKPWFTVNYNGIRLHDRLLQFSCNMSLLTSSIQRNYMYYNFCHRFELQTIFRNSKMNSLRVLCWLFLVFKLAHHR